MQLWLIVTTCEPSQLSEPSQLVRPSHAVNVCLTIIVAGIPDSLVPIQLR